MVSLELESIVYETDANPLSFQFRGLFDPPVVLAQGWTNARSFSALGVSSSGNSLII
jgi:hypothetical protein